MHEREDRRRGLLADPASRAILTAVSDIGQPLHVEELAERLVRRDDTVLRSPEYERRLERERLTLHHDRLPRLAEAGLLDYDRDENVVTFQRDVPVDVDWLDGGGVDDALARFGTGRRDGDAIGVVEGRDSVIETGRRLADVAEEELFCMYVSTDLLEDECIDRARDAIGRGVAMYVGSRNADVRELTRRHLPEATVWEPQLGWLDAPTGYPKVGRLVLVDRRKVMFAVLEEPGSGDTDPGEVAALGEGEGHPLVVLVRELLGPRLDHLDHQSAGFRSELPS